MQEILIQKLHEYLVHHNLDVIVSLQQEGKLTAFLTESVAAVEHLYQEMMDEQRPMYVIEALCMEVMTQAFRPSRYLYVKGVLESEFPAYYSKAAEAGTLTYELINMINSCIPAFELLGFSEENEDNRFIRYAVIGTIHAYLTHQ